MAALPAEVPTLAILAGGGAAPKQLAAACRRAGRRFFLVGLEGHADPDIVNEGPHAWIPLGALGQLKELVRREGLTEAVLIGRVRRPSLSELKPDGVALRVLLKMGLMGLGDDGFLRGVSRALEEECGVRILGAHEVFGDLLMPEGPLTDRMPNAESQADIRRGMEVAEALGRLDVGQAVVVQQGLVLGVEALEGTDALLARAATLRREGPGGVVVKCAKPGQDNRFDLPTVGPLTLRGAAAAGLQGVALEAGRGLLLEREVTLRIARETGLFLIGVQRMSLTA